MENTVLNGSIIHRPGRWVPERTARPQHSYEKSAIPMGNERKSLQPKKKRCTSQLLQ